LPDKADWCDDVMPAFYRRARRRQEKTLARRRPFAYRVDLPQTIRL